MPLDREALMQEIHFWRELVTPVKSELQQMMRRHPECAAEIQAILAMFDRRKPPKEV